jgi:penicillin amidase
LLRRYTEGVEAGRRSLRQHPFEYQLLRTEPAPWCDEDALLAVLNMYLLLQDGLGERERAMGLLYDHLPGPLADFLCPAGSTWDAPLDGSVVAAPPLPGPEVLDLRKRPPGWKQPFPLRLGRKTEEERLGKVHFGSNSWAVAGSRTAHGGAILANDMHLMLMVPGIWYRAAFVRPGEDGRESRVVGITLPGTPGMVVGSNGHVAWGFTNTEGDWSDRILLDRVSDDPNAYQTPDGPRPLSRRTEIIHVRGGKDVELTVEETIWGPVIENMGQGRRVALRWVAHDPEALNLQLVRMETVRTVEEALALAPTVGSPAQNLLAADDQGNIGWTIMGRIPRRVGPAGDWGQRPTSWADGKRWDGWLPSEEYPRVVNPPEGILWTANNRVVGPAAQAVVGAVGYDLGARARQIRDGLRVRDKLTEADMLAIQLDNRAVFLDRWRRLLLEVLGKGSDPDWALMRQELAAGADRADPASVGFRIVRGFRIYVHEIVLEGLTVPAGRGSGFSIHELPAAVEDSVWRLIRERPLHLLPIRYATWDDLLAEAVNRLRDRIRGPRDDFGAAVKRFTWGELNGAHIKHPLSIALGPLAAALELDMPADELAGDDLNMPRILRPSFGASERLAVSPGRESVGYFHMPAGQSSHPLSPHYRDGHAAWVRGEATPFLPGERRHVLVLKPGH